MQSVGNSENRNPDNFANLPDRFLRQLLPCHIQETQQSPFAAQLVHAIEEPLGPLKLVSPSTAMNSAFLFPRASRQSKEIPAADSVVSRAQINCKPARSSNFSFSPVRA